MYQLELGEIQKNGVIEFNGLKIQVPAGYPAFPWDRIGSSVSADSYFIITETNNTGHQFPILGRERRDNHLQSFSPGQQICIPPGSNQPYSLTTMLATCPSARSGVLGPG